MPFPALTTSGFSSKEDSKYFQATPTDGSIKYETQGGIFVTRKQYTRQSPLTFVTGFTDIPDSDKLLFDAFWWSMNGCAESFTYVHPTTGTNYTVRFDDVYKTAYMGYGHTYHWDVTDIKLRTV